MQRNKISRGATKVLHIFQKGIHNTEHGITLVALIITVIVLLILAMVSIRLVMNGGIIDKAEKGTESYSAEEELEQIKLAVASAKLAGNGFLTTENLNAELQKVFKNTETVSESNDYYSYKTDKNYRIYKDGTVEETESIIARIPTDYQEVEYIESTGTQFINTEIYPKSVTKIFFDFEFTEISNVGNGWGSAENNEAFLWGVSKNSFSSYVNSTWILANTGISCDLKRHTFFLESGKQVFDGLQYGETTIGNTATNKQYMYLFAEHWEWDNRAGTYSKRCRWIL